MSHDLPRSWGIPISQRRRSCKLPRDDFDGRSVASALSDLRQESRT
jgi:hypothetical protein